MKKCQYCGADEGEFHKPLCPITKFRQAQNAYVEPTNAAKDTIIASLTRERDEAREECERLREDAERYRWLRDHYPYAAHIALTNTARGTRILIDDDAIDAARAGDAAE